MGSRGSVIPIFQRLKRDGVREFPVTDRRMTLFWSTLEQGVDLPRGRGRDGHREQHKCGVSLNLWFRYDAE